MSDMSWGEIVGALCGIFTGFVYARTAHLFRVMGRRGHLSRCAWCNGHIVDLRTPGAQESMKHHVVTCAARTAVQS